VDGHAQARNLAGEKVLTKQHRGSSPKEMTAPQFVENFFTQLGVGTSVKPQHFFKKLEKRFGSIAAEFADRVEARGRGDRVDVYPIKNHSLDFANVIAGQYDRDRIKATAVWFLQEGWDLSKARFLEIGCDNGILTCLLASVFPQAEFVGVDNCSEGIQIAKKRASALGLDNAKFIDFDFGATDCEVKLGHFDFALALTTFHEIVDPTELLTSIKSRCGGKGVFSIQDLDDCVASEKLPTEPIEAVSKLLSEDGRFISIDRLPSHEQTLLWIRSVERAGLTVELPKSYIIEAKGFDGTKERLPLTVFSKSAKGSPKACDILSFYSYRDFIDKNLVREIDNHVLAELIYGSLDKHSIVEHECVYSDGSGIEKLEMGVANGLGYVYNVTSRGFRRLVLLPSACLYEHLDALSEYDTSHAKVGKTTVRWSGAKELAVLGITSSGVV
jgi:2-polyprenyl-3-methyl-5-hydroxy-6-metoxy-1,4-benzoquinol methylase